MSFLSPQTIEERFDELITEGGSIGNIQNGAYALSLGTETFQTSHESKMYEVKDQWRVGQQISIAPGQFALLISRESVCIPKDLLGFLSIRSSLKFKGLINVSGFHVDPGYRGKIKYTVYNAGSQPVIIEFGKPTFLLWFAEFDKTLREGEERKNKEGQFEITPEDVGHLVGEIASPSSLQKQLNYLKDEQSKLARKFSRWKILVWTLITGLAIALITQYVNNIRTDHTIKVIQQDRDVK